MFTDTVGSAASAQSDEAGALQRLTEQEELLRPLFREFLGREVKSTGDGFLVEFGSALKATQCAVEIQRRLYERNARPGRVPIRLRIGIHLGDVEPRGDDIFGDAVNIAARVEPLAEPGGICLSEQVVSQIRQKVPFQLERQGPRRLKGIEAPVDVYRVHLPWLSLEEERPPAEATRIAVLPFANMSPDPADEYFADGMTEELIDRLSQVQKLKVIARTSVMSYKGVPKKASDIGRELTVGSLVEGSVRKTGARVRVTVQLVNARSEEHLWSAHYDRALDDIFLVQSEIAEKVVGELGVHLLASEKSALEKHPTESTEAYSHYLRGWELYRDGTEQGFRAALGLFEKAVELDPSFARAHVAVAECHERLGLAGYEPWDSALARWKSSVERAMALDPALPEAHVSLAAWRMIVEDDLPGAEVEARNALGLNPSLPDAYFVLAQIAGIRGEPEEMVRHVERAHRLDPVEPLYIQGLGEAYFFTGHEAEAVEHWNRMEQLDPEGTAVFRTEYYLSKGDLASAQECYARAKNLSSRPGWLAWMEGTLAARSGDKERALRIIQEIDGARHGLAAPCEIGYVYHALGDLDAFFDYMNQALEAHALDTMRVMYSPLFARARTDPRYRGLIEKARRRFGLAR